MKIIVRVSIILVASSCSTGKPKSTENYLQFVLRSDPASFDPLHSANFANAVLQRQILECLFEYDYATDDAKTIPLLAKQFTVSEDRLQYDIFLRDDAQFFDNFSPALFPDQVRSVNAHDVLYCWLRQADARNNSDGYWALKDTFAGVKEFHLSTAGTADAAEIAFNNAILSGIEGIKVVDDYHLRLRLQQPDPWLQNRLAMSYFAVYPREAVETTARNMQDQPVGSGVFYLDEFTPGQNVTLTRTPKWREKNVGAPAGVSFQVIRDLQTTIELFKQKQNDRITISFASADHFLNNEGELKKDFINQGIGLSHSPRPDITMLCFNMTDSSIGNIKGDTAGNLRRKELRHALALAFPRDQWIDLMHQGLPSLLAKSFIPPSTSADHLTFPWHDDLDLARQILTAAGYYSDFELPQLEFVLFNTDPLSIALGEIYATSLKRLGIECKVTPTPYAQLLEQAVRGEAQLFVRNWALDWPDSSLIYSTFDGDLVDTNINLSHFSNEKFDELLGQLRLCTDQSQRILIEQQLDAILYEECPAVPLEHNLSLILSSSRISNFKIRRFDHLPCKSYLLTND